MLILKKSLFNIFLIKPSYLINKNPREDLMKKFLVFLALILLVLGFFPSEKVLALGPDEKIAALKNAGIIKGYPDGSLGLERPISRAEIAVLLTKLKAQDLESSGQVVFKDLGADHWP